MLSSVLLRFIEHHALDCYAILACFTLLWFVSYLVRISRINISTGKIYRPRKLAAISDVFKGFRFFLSGPDIISKGYGKESRDIFTVPTPENYLVMVTSKEKMKELLEASESDLSLHAAAIDMFHPKYTMYHYDLQERATDNSKVHMRVLRTLLTFNISALEMSLERKVAAALSDQIEKHGNSNRWTNIPTFSMAKAVVTRANSCIFFGEDLSNDAEFLKAALNYPEDVFKTGEALRLTPSGLCSFVASLCTHKHAAQNKLLNYLLPLAEERLALRGTWEGSEREKPHDCIQWIVDSSPKERPWNAGRVVQEALALWFGSVHQPSMTLTYAIYDLCDYPEYIAPLRQELGRLGNGEKYWLPESLPLLDSFLKESARLHPAEAISLRRKALTNFTFADGTELETGSWACAPQKALMRDGKNYSHAETFDGFRFANNDSAKSKFTDIDPSFPFWGAGKRICPGRYYASSVLKMILKQILLNHDCRLLEAGATRSFTWRTSIVPRSSTILQMRNRFENVLQPSDVPEGQILRVISD